MPGVWNRLDVPDLIAMAAPKACMVVGGTEDLLFPPLGQEEASRQIVEAFNWAGAPDLFRSDAPAKPTATIRTFRMKHLACSTDT
jgi:hypothetical protein